MTVTLVPETGDERPSQQIARRVRGLLGENQISGRRMAAALHMDQNAFSRRYRGDVPWAIDELARLAPLLGTSLGELCAIRDSNPEPADSAPRLTLYVGARVWGDFATVPAAPFDRNGRHLALVDSVGGAA